MFRALIYAQNSSKVIIDGGKFDTSYKFGINLINSTAGISDGEFNCYETAVQVESGRADISGGTFKTLNDEKTYLSQLH